MKKRVMLSWRNQSERPKLSIKRNKREPMSIENCSEKELKKLLTLRLSKRNQTPMLPLLRRKLQIK
jgi:hypothetical protein